MGSFYFLQKVSESQTVWSQTFSFLPFSEIKHQGPGYVRVLLPGRQMGAIKLTEMKIIKVLRISKPFKCPKTQLNTRKQNTKWDVSLFSRDKLC